MEDTKARVSDIVPVPFIVLSINVGFASGELKIAEVTSRFKDVKQFEKLVAELGFQAKSKVSAYVRECESGMLIS